MITRHKNRHQQNRRLRSRILSSESSNTFFVVSPNIPSYALNATHENAKKTNRAYNWKMLANIELDTNQTKLN